MSLLDRPGPEKVIVFPEDVSISPDGNVTPKAATLGIETTATIQPISSTEQGDPRGTLTTELYRLHFPRSFTTELGPKSVIVWNGERFSVHGFPVRYNGSRQTARVEYTIKRS